MFNLLNAANPQSFNYTYSGTGATWRNAAGVAPGRFMKIGAQLDF